MKSIGAASVAGLFAGCSESSGGESDQGSSEESDQSSGGNLFPNRELNLAAPTISSGVIDPHQTGAIQNNAAITMAYERPILRGPEGDKMPGLATDWGREEPGRFRFQIREGVTFHNGDEMTAEDWEYSVARIQDPDVHVTSALQGNLPGVTGTEIIDDYTIDILSDGTNSFVENACAHFLGLSIVNKSWTQERSPDETAVQSNGTGPMQLVNHNPGNDATYEPYEDYWGELPEWASEVDTVTVDWIAEDSTRVSGLRANEYQIAESVPPTEVPAINQNEDLGISTSPTSRVLKIVMDQRQEPWNVWEMRHAMNLAVDVDGYIEDVMDGFAVRSTQPTLPQMYGYDPDIEPIPYDPDRADELIEEAGYAGMELELTVPTGRFLLGEEFGVAVANQIDQLETISCEPDIVPYGGGFTDKWARSRPMDLDFFIVGYGHPSYDGRETINSTLIDTNGQSRFGENPRYDELVDLFEESISTPLDEAEPIVQEMNRLVVEERGWVFLHGQQALIGYDNALDYQGREDELLTPLDSGLAE